ncbi:MAG TPA: sodium:proton antiporter NhaD [Paludibacteraceae bacterium]|nr:sodium:proton antiporter NhaD [Paludibacteraceae bacterium]
MITIIIILFVIGYAAIALEHNIKINKTASALITGVVLWVVYILTQSDTHLVNEELLKHLGDISSILFFLMGAMTIVELIDTYNGFEVITERITQTKKVSLLWIIGILTFFLSAVLDNLTTTIVMVSLLRKLIKDHETRLFYVGIVVIAANAGGAWSPIGDVTTTMLWIGGQISAFNIMARLFAPSFISLAIPLGVLSLTMKGRVERPFLATETYKELSRRQQSIILILGLSMLIMVPIFKTLTHLPPFMGMMLGLGVLWIVTDIMHRNHTEDQPENGKRRTVTDVLTRIDLPSILFFLGILLAVASLEVSGILHTLSQFLDEKIGNLNFIVIAIGLASAIIDNVPLVAATQGMYDLAQFPMDHYLWEFLAYCAGTGGSILIIGSAAGVAAMGMEKINFFWYVKKISWLALLGYLAGAAFYIVEYYFSHGAFYH